MLSHWRNISFALLNETMPLLSVAMRETSASCSCLTFLLYDGRKHQVACTNTTKSGAYNRNMLLRRMGNGPGVGLYRGFEPWAWHPSNILGVFVHFDSLLSSHNNYVPGSVPTSFELAVQRSCTHNNRLSVRLRHKKFWTCQRKHNYYQNIQRK